MTRPPRPAPRAPAWLRAALLCAVLAMLAMLAMLAPPQARGADGVPLERQVKAAYLAKFAAFIEWPDGSFAQPDSPLLIGVAGNDALAEQLDQMSAGRSVNGHPLAVRRLRRGDTVDGLHVLFVGAMERAAMAELFGQARNRSLLTVADTEDAVSLGSMLRFVVTADRLRFEVALKNVAASRLRISARLLAAAWRVQGAA